MSDWPGGRRDVREGDRIALDDEAVDDLDGVVQEAVDAVEAAEANRRQERWTAREKADDDAEVGEASVPEDDVSPSGTETMADLQAELEELRQRSTRTLADFDNYRKRIEREKGVQERFNGMEVLRGLLDIVDNLERALASDGPIDDLKTGVELTLRQAERLLDRHGVKKIEADGEPFDPSLHEAVSRSENDAVTEPRVATVLQSGYLMHERLLRPARVSVVVPGPTGTPAGGGAEIGGSEEG